MDFNTFKNNWLGKVVDADGAYGYQCVDLIREYLAETRGLARSGAWGNAINYWTSPVPQVLAVCDKIATNDPIAGDIIIFRTLGRTDYSGEGHIGLATGNKNGAQVETLEQNGSTGSGDGQGGNKIRTRYIDRSRIAGVLRLKPINTQGSNVTLTRDDANTLYRRLFNRDGDAGGLNNYTGKTLDFALQDMLGSQEFQNIMKSKYTVEKVVTKEVATGPAATPKQLAAEAAVNALKDAFNK